MPNPEKRPDRTARRRTQASAGSSAFGAVIFPIHVAVRVGIALVLVVPVLGVARDDADVTMVDTSCFQISDSATRVTVIVVET